MKRLLLALSWLIPLVAFGQLETVRKEVRAEYLRPEASSQADVLAKKMLKDGSWRDIDYRDPSRANWPACGHLGRLETMSLAYEKGGRQDRRLYDKILKGLHYWYRGHFHNDNWWYEKIGVPSTMLSIAYILDDDVPSALRDSVRATLSQIDSDDYPARPGGDRIKVLSNHAKCLLWDRDEQRLSQIWRKIESEARVAPLEEIMYNATGGLSARNEYLPAGRGVQADMSFHHRGDRVDNTVCYGLALLEHYSYWARLLEKTPWRFSDAHTHFVIDYLLDGVRRHLVGTGRIEPSILNREVCRPHERHVLGPSYARDLLAICGGYREAELRHMLDIQEGRKPFDGSWAYLFWKSDYFVFARPTFQTAVRFHSERVSNIEDPHNHEGISNHYRGDGACMLTVNGHEYDGIQPVFDFRMIPGATTPLVRQMPPERQVQVLWSKTRFAGSVCDTLYGAVAFDFKSQRSDLVAKKSWFFFDAGYVCLGSGISCSTADTIVTTLEQCRLKGPVVKHGNRYVHAGNAYLLLSDNPVMMSAQFRHGTWGNCVAETDYTRLASSDSIFTLALSHGVSPVSSTYAYAVVPGGGQDAQPWFRILSNDERVQAVESLDGSLSYVVFYEAAQIETAQGALSADRPCLVMIRNGQVSVSDPTQRQYYVMLGYRGSQKQIYLPTFQRAGTTVRAF